MSTASSDAPFGDEIREYYSLNERVYPKFAPFYDFVVSPFKRIRHEVVRFTDAPTNSKVLDVATGTGEQALAFAAAGHTVVGLDISEAMLARAKRKAPGQNPRFLQGDATRLPFPPADFDVTCISFGLHEMPPTIRERILGEMARVTKPHGKVVTVDYGLPAGDLASAVVFHAVKLYEPKPYPEFVRSDLPKELERAGVVVEQDRSTLLGAVRIVVGRPVASRMMGA